MNERILIKDLHDHIEKEVTVQGWVDVRRDHGKLVFLDLRDRSGFVQAVALPNHPEAVAVAQTVRPEYVVSVTAIVNKRPERMVKEDQQNGDIELELVSIEVLSEAQELPFDKDAELNIDTLLDFRPLTVRRAREQAIFKVQHEITQAYRAALVERDFIEFMAPKIVGGDAEGGAEVFSFDYFNDTRASLATSPQLYKQIMVGAYERVFNVSTVFRAELHSTSRHLNEYTTMDAEFGFIKDHTDVMAMLTYVIQKVVTHLEKTCAKEFALLDVTLPKTPTTFPVLKLRDAQKLIFKETGDDCREEKDLTPEHERWLCNFAAQEHNSDFIFVTHFPLTKTAFYAHEDPDDPGYACYFDLLFRGIEITSGGQREHNHDTLVQKIKGKGLDAEQFSFYLQAFKYGLPPHGGWGMGLERLTEKMLNIANVKEATLFPRDMNRIDGRLTSE